MTGPRDLIQARARQTSANKHNKNGKLTHPHIAASHSSPSIFPLTHPSIQCRNHQIPLTSIPSNIEVLLHYSRKPRKTKGQTEERPSDYINPIPSPASQDTPPAATESYACAAPLDYSPGVDVDSAEEAAG